MTLRTAIRSLSVSASVVVAIASGLRPAEAEPTSKPHQVVIISFDGAHDVALWRRSRDLARKTGAHFTYFLSCVFLLSPDTKGLYKAPGKPAGRSNVGFALSQTEVASRLWQIWFAHTDGHDIASHGCGHFDGKDWTAAQWGEEFTQARSILRDAWSTNGLQGEPTGWRQFTDAPASGFRAPYLSTGKGLEPAERTAGFSYDASGVSRGPVEPAGRDGILHFALPQIPEGPSGRNVIAMDYNLFVRHSGGIERNDAGGTFEQRTLAAFNTAFEKQYDGERIPLQLGFHFVLMNGGAYWRALERFAGDVCLRADVDCISYADYVSRRKAMPDKDTERTRPVGG